MFPSVSFLQNALTVIGDKMQQARVRKKHFDGKLRGHLDRVQELKVVEEKKGMKFEVEHLSYSVLSLSKCEECRFL